MCSFTSASTAQTEWSARYKGKKKKKKERLDLVVKI